MDDRPAVLGLNSGQNASLCLMQGGRLSWAIRKDHPRRRPDDSTPDGLPEASAVQLPGLDRPPDIVIDCLSSGEATRGATADGDDPAALVLAPSARRVRISQHLAQLYSAFHPSPFDEAAVMVIGQGSPVTAFTEHWSGAAHTPGDWREVASFYTASRSHVACIGKQVRDGGDAQLVGLGLFQFLLEQALFPGAGREGKAMELAPYGAPAALGLPPLDVEDMAVGIPPAWRALLRERERFRFGGLDARFTDCANLAAAGQRAFEEALLEMAHWLYRQTGAGQLCFAGAPALNCAANARLLRATPFRRIFVPPAPGPAGAALGCAIYGTTELARARCDFRWTSDYLGPLPQPDDIEAALQGSDDLVVEHTRGREVLCARMLDLLCSGRVLALYQGRAEFGARALGHRSILADPRRERVRDWINARIKEREWFCPLAPVVPEERAPAFFDLGGPSPFMSFAVPVRREIAPMLPAVTHVDGSARLQTVGPDDDPLLRALLAGFEVRTGVPVLLNTSFCGRGKAGSGTGVDAHVETLVDTPFDAVAAFRRLPLHALAMPPYLVTKRREPGLPA